MAVITAGWQEREAEVDELRQHVRRPVTNLMLHERAELVFQDNPEVFEAHRRRQNQLKELQQLYRLRLNHTMAAARALFAQEGRAELLEPERESAVAAVRNLDDHHLRRLAEVNAAFDAEWGERVRAATAPHRQEIEEILGQSSALGIAGGHVAVLLNRMRLFGLGKLLRGPLSELPVIAWSAGAMVLAERVLLFHDRPPQGFGNAEVFERGLGLYTDVVPLPHAQLRLRLDDPVRVALLARRLAPAQPITMDDGSRLSRSTRGWRAAPGTLRLTTAGTLEPAFK